jgi:catalase
MATVQAATVQTAPSDQLSREVIQAFDDLSGVHPGYRPTHAKGVLLSGEFRPSPAGEALTVAAHLHRPSTPVTVRFSNFGGVPTISDTDPLASPRGMAVRFHLAEHVHTDIVAHSVDGFPARTVEEFVGFLQAIRATMSSQADPSPIEMFLKDHPAARTFVLTPKPTPVSFATELFYSVTAYKFTNSEGVEHYGRYRIVPSAGAQFLSSDESATRPPNFLFDELESRLHEGPLVFHILLQLAEPGDPVDDSTVQWPDSRQVVEFGMLTISAVVPANQEAQQRIIFDPIPRLEGIAPSADPLLQPRADVYLMSGRRRRQAHLEAPAP